MATTLNHGSRPWLGRAVTTPLHALLGWYRVSQERAELRKMPPERLSDVGLTQREVDWELSRPFWRAERDS